MTRAADRLPIRFGPALRTVHPRHVVWDGELAGLDRVEDVLIAPPLGDAADFFARCVALGIRDGPANGWGAIASRFRESYLAASRSDPGDLALFEATALLRLACRRARDPDESELVRQLLDLAETRLMMVGTAP